MYLVVKPYVPQALKKNTVENIGVCIERVKLRGRVIGKPLVCQNSCKNILLIKTIFSTFSILM